MANITCNDDLEISPKENMHKASRQPILAVESLHDSLKRTQDVIVKSSNVRVYVIALRPKEA